MLMTALLIWVSEMVLREMVQPSRFTVAPLLIYSTTRLEKSIMETPAIQLYCISPQTVPKEPPPPSKFTQEAKKVRTNAR